MSYITALTASQKEELIASLATMVIGTDVTAEALVSVAEKSGNTLSASHAALFAKVAEASGGIDTFCAAPGAGGGGGGGGGGGDGGADDAAAPKEEEKEEEESVDMGGGGGMFDDGEEATGDY